VYIYVAKPKYFTMTKIKYSSENITPFGGLNFINDLLKKNDLPNFIDKTLGFRNYRAKYAYSDIIFSLLNNSLCNGEFVSDLKHLKNQSVGSFKEFIPSHDTVEYAFQELKTPNKIIITPENVRHEINQNNTLNDLLIGACVKLNMLKPEVKDYVLDFDNVVLNNDKQDAKTSYKMTKAYHPNFANIGNCTVYFENRNGNTPAKYAQKEALETCFNNLKSRGINIKSFRGDAASYQKEVIDVLELNVSHFYIRNVTSAGFRNICIEENNWETVEINYEKKEVTSIKHTPFQGDKEYRIVVTRTKIKDTNTTNLFPEYSYTYYGIITNDMESSNLEVIIFYNKRGDDSENNNKNLLNDFNIHRLPFMDLDTNTVYIGLMAVCSTIFEWIKMVLVANKVDGVESQHRTKRIFMLYISVCAKFITHARETTFVIFSTTRKYQPLII
jgi:hypothetical protein